MVVVDTSVLIDFLNGYMTSPVNRLRTLIREETLLVGDIVLCEVLKGARGKAHARLLERELQQFEWVRMLDASIATAAAANYRELRNKGITIYKTIDLIIGTYCIVHEHSLLHSDRDFDPMEQHLGLKVVPTYHMVNEPRLAYG
jgi:predicted nucleic acid-binding protein